MFLINVTTLGFLVTVLCGLPPCSAAEQKPSCKPTHFTNKTISLINCNAATNPVDSETSTRVFINNHAQDLNLPTANVSLKLIARKKTLHGQTIRFQKIINGYPVYNSTLSVRQDNTGHIYRVHSQDNTLQNSKITRQKKSLSIKAIINRHQAEKIALQTLTKNAVGKADLKIREPAEKTWYPNPDGSLTLAWKMLILGDNPSGDFRLIIDAEDGTILLQQNLIAFFQRGQGWGFRPNPVQSSGITSLIDNGNTASSLLTSQLIDMTLQGLSDAKKDNFSLKGQFVDVATLNTKNHPQSQYPDATQPDRKYFYNRNDPRFEQVMVYQTIDSYQRYLQALGFNNNNAVPNGIHQFPILANAHWYGQDLSFYRPTDDTLHFGDGGVDDAEDADIILHEYGHAIQQAQNSEWGCSDNDYCEMNAMGEGFSDYIAADFHAHQGSLAYQKKHAACVGEWDGTAYSETIPTCLRRVDSDKTYKNLTVAANITEHDKMYLDSAIWSRVLWDIRKALGSNIANQIILEHHYALPVDATMPLAALEMLSIDAKLFGGLHEVALRKAFCTRGILNKTQCTAPKNKKISIYASKDSFIEQTHANTNAGSHKHLKIGGDSTHEARTLLGFNLATVDIKKVKSAILELTIANSDNQWGTYGRPIDIHPLRTDFTEGRAGSYNLKVWPWIILSKMPGVTWNCATDQNIINNRLDCPSSWSGGLDNHKFGQVSSAPWVQTSNMTGKVYWTVTDDIKAGIHTWIIKKTFPEMGQVEYYSREGALKMHNITLSPHIIITFK